MLSSAGRQPIWKRKGVRTRRLFLSMPKTVMIYMAAHKVNRPFTLRNGQFSFGKQAPYMVQKNEFNFKTKVVP